MILACHMKDRDVLILLIRLEVYISGNSAQDTLPTQNTTLTPRVHKSLNLNLNIIARTLALENTRLGSTEILLSMEDELTV